MSVFCSCSLTFGFMVSFFNTGPQNRISWFARYVQYKATVQDVMIFNLFQYNATIQNFIFINRFHYKGTAQEFMIFSIFSTRPQRRMSWFSIYFNTRAQYRSSFLALDFSTRPQYMISLFSFYSIQGKNTGVQHFFVVPWLVVLWSAVLVQVHSTEFHDLQDMFSTRPQYRMWWFSIYFNTRPHLQNFMFITRFQYKATVHDFTSFIIFNTRQEYRISAFFLSPDFWFYGTKMVSEWSARVQQVSTRMVGQGRPG